MNLKGMWKHGIDKVIIKHNGKNADGFSQLELVLYKFLIASVRSTNNIAPYIKHIMQM